MTLRDKFDSISCSGCDMPYCDFKCTNLSKRELNFIENIADDYAVNFAEWLMIDCDYQNHCVWEYKGIEYTNFELLEMFKKEKGL